jgi:hypothetical protein
MITRRSSTARSKTQPTTTIEAKTKPSYAENTVRALRPDEDGVGHVAERLIHRDDDRADNARREPHIVEAEAHVRTGEVGSCGRKNEADCKPRRESERDTDRRGEVRGEQDLGKNRRERAAEERRIDVRTKGLAAEPRVERNARDDWPDIEKVLAEQPEP